MLHQNRRRCLVFDQTEYIAFNIVGLAKTCEFTDANYYCIITVAGRGCRGESLATQL